MLGLYFSTVCLYAVETLDFYVQTQSINYVSVDWDALSFESNPICMDTLKLESIRLDYTPYAILSLAFFLGMDFFIYIVVGVWVCEACVALCIFLHYLYALLCVGA